MIQRINAWLLGIGAFLGLIAALSAQTVTVQSGRVSLMNDQQSVRLSSGETTLLECRGIELGKFKTKTTGEEWAVYKTRTNLLKKQK